MFKMLPLFNYNIYCIIKLFPMNGSVIVFGIAKKRSFTLKDINLIGITI